VASQTSRGVARTHLNCARSSALTADRSLCSEDATLWAVVGGLPPHGDGICLVWRRADHEAAEDAVHGGGDSAPPPMMDERPPPVGGGGNGESANSSGGGCGGFSSSWDGGVGNGGVGGASPSCSLRREISDCASLSSCSTSGWRLPYRPLRALLRSLSDPIGPTGPSSCDAEGGAWVRHDAARRPVLLGGGCGIRRGVD
jgi:hypothetical protein